MDQSLIFLPEMALFQESRRPDLRGGLAMVAGLDEQAGHDLPHDEQTFLQCRTEEVWRL
ncbi:hypothetical protein [Acetobacter conturbans]|uniref:Uncharacterized protein n=1 Tax=Acetobacter conturbans TaxID=1737472 RepID=A0ABX0K5B2_9PROT|nr:hypothetical protein [Acetobacter conturbans]NHN89538.1 hypothetical protein [Acetobacter conturbans]